MSKVFVSELRVKDPDDKFNSHPSVVVSIVADSFEEALEKIKKLSLSVESLKEEKGGDYLR